MKGKLDNAKEEINEVEGISIFTKLFKMNTQRKKLCNWCFRKKEKKI